MLAELALLIASPMLLVLGAAVITLILEALDKRQRRAAVAAPHNKGGYIMAILLTNKTAFDKVKRYLEHNCYCFTWTECNGQYTIRITY